MPVMTGPSLLPLVFTPYFQALSLPVALVLLVPIAYKAVSQIIRKKLRETLTALDDLSLLSDAKKDEDIIQGTAVICGGSIAGLVAARVCSNHFKQVVIIEPEEWVTIEEGLRDRHRDNSATENPPPKRSRVAQYTALHAYHAFLTLMFRQLFPGIGREFEREGARIVSLEVKATLSGVPMLPPYHHYPNRTLPKVIFATRPVLETVLRRVVMLNCPNVIYHCGSVTGLLQSESSSHQLSGVKVKSRNGEEQHISASLVVDCTGPALGGLRWLKDLALSPNTPTAPVPVTPFSLENLKTTYDHRMAYTTCEFDVPSNLFGALQELGFPVDYETVGNVFIYFPNPNVERSNLLIQRRENNILHIGCGGWDDHERRTSVADIKSFLSQMTPARPIPKWIFAMLDLFEQENVPASFCFSRCPPAVYIQYHRAKNLPSNFVAVGDSVMQSNPIAGQGCTKACVEAVTLNAILARCVPAGSGDTLPSDFSQRYFSARAMRTGHVWESMKTTDYSFKTTIPAPGDNLETTNSWRRAYESAIMRLSITDMYVAGVVYQTSNWLAPVTDVFSPVIIGKVFWLKIRDFMGI